MSIKPYIEVLRPLQWVKNILIFFPALLAHTLHPTVPLLTAFLAFSLISSAGYILNDLLDREADRKHPFKRKRPIPSGRLSVRAASVYWPILFLLSGYLGVMIGLPFLGVLLLYFFLTNLYNFYLKEIVLADVLLLAALYTLRLFAGSVTAGVVLSEWFLAFAVFLFTSLAFVKRQTELLFAVDEDEASVPRRGYLPMDVPFLTICGVASGYLSVLVLALYLNSRKIVLMYHHPHYLWLICPILIYWISRVWLLTLRRTMHCDPIVFLIKDRTSLFLIACSIFIIGMAL